MSSTNRGAKRVERDAYNTPTEAVEALIPHLVLDPTWWMLEPCVGSGNILRAFQPYVGVVEVCEIAEPYSIDFLTYDAGRRYDLIVTNPPFSLAQEFVTKALELANCVIMLLPLSFLGSQRRRDWWRQHPPTAIFILSKRPSFTGKGTDATEYGWFVIDTTGRQKVGIHWL